MLIVKLKRVSSENSKLELSVFEYLNKCNRGSIRLFKFWWLLSCFLTWNSNSELWIHSKCKTHTHCKQACLQACKSYFKYTCACMCSLLPYILMLRKVWKWGAKIKNGARLHPNTTELETQGRWSVGPGLLLCSSWISVYTWILF